MCKTCAHQEVCKIMDILAKFDEDAKKQLGVNIAMEDCFNYDNVENESE